MHNIPDIIDQIFDFNEQVIGTPSGPINGLTQKQHEWTQKFCAEELSELRDAFEVVDIPQIADAVADLIYGAMGTFKKMGLTRLQVRCIFKAVHMANMTKKRGDKGRGSDEDAVKPEDFVPPEQVIANIMYVWNEATCMSYLVGKVADNGDKGGEFGGCAA